MTKMRAVSQDVFGGPEVLKLVELERPEPGLSEVLVRVHAAGLNPTDWKHRARKIYLGDPPFVLGWDVSGVVEAVGRGVTLLKPGDEVFGMLSYPYGVGAFAEYVTTHTRNLVHKPQQIDHVQAAALPLAALTAWQALVDTAGVQPGQRVLVHGAAGGVGHLAVQIAKARGSYVLGTASAPKHEFLRQLGADELIDYRAVDFADVAHEVDVVLDAVGGDYATRSLPCLRTGGILITIVPAGFEHVDAGARERGVRAELMLVEADQGGMSAVAELVVADMLRAEIAGTFPLKEAAKAHELGETNRTIGKLVLTLQ